VNDNINIDSTITGSLDDNINMDSTIKVLVNDNINIDSTSSVSCVQFCLSMDCPLDYIS
jgi:hypothetical protein